MKKIYLQSQAFICSKSMLRSFFSAIALLLLNYGVSAQDFFINFYPGSDTVNIESVKVENLSNETVYNMTSADALHVIESSDVRFIANSQNKCEIFPNPAESSFFVNFFAESDGLVSIIVFDIEGRQIMNENFYAAKGFYKTEINGAINGLYFVCVRGEGYSYTGKIAGTASNNQALHATVVQAVTFSEEKIPVTKLGDLYDMPYKYGDVLIFTFISSTGNITIKPVVINNQGIIADGETLTLTVNFYRCRDNEDYEYSVVEVEEKVWMAENLNTEYFSNNSHIHIETSDNSWGQLNTVAFCNYLNDGENANIYGKLYNWHSVAYNGGLCPSGWHVPSDAEWLNLEKYIGVSATVVGKKGWRGDPFGCYLKASGTDFWSVDPDNQTNAAGFFALPAGIRTLTGEFHHQGDYAAWWTATETDGQNAWCRALSADSCNIYREDGSKTLGLSVRCVYNDVQDITPPEFLIPQVNTLLVESIYMESAYFEGEILSNGGAEIIETGFVLDTISAPTIATAEFVFLSQADAVLFSASVTGLTPNKVYYLRAFARNSVGIAYGSELNFSTLKKYYTDGSGITDIDGNFYQTVNMGSTEYMISNLKSSRLNNGTPILRADDPLQWTSNSSSMYCWYDDDSLANESTNGKLYNNNAVNTGRLCPDGWHVASDSEWKLLEFYLEMTPADTLLTGWRESDQGSKLKDRGTENWLSPNTGATNQSGYTAMGSGYRNNDGGFAGKGESFCTWTSTMGISQKLWIRKLSNLETRVYRETEEDNFGFSVRCIKTPLTAPFVVTGSTSDISISSAIIHSDIVDYNSLEIISRGIVWNTTGNPDLNIYEGKTDEGSGSGQIVSVIYSLEPATQYYVRAYATNELGTVYGAEISFTTLSPIFTPGPGINDMNNNFYKTIIINNREWMGENLKGSPLPVTPTPHPVEIDRFKTNLKVNRDTSINDSLYGGLFTAAELLQKGVMCPMGWTVATEGDWQELEVYLGMTTSEANTMGWRGTNEGGKMKEPGFINWNIPNTGATNETGFDFRPGGYIDEFGVYNGEGSVCRFWTLGADTLEPYYNYAREITFDNARINRIASNPDSRYSARCVKPSNLPIVFTKEIAFDEFDDPYSGGTIFYQGASEIVSKGIVWAKDKYPTLYNFMGRSDDGSGSDEYTSTFYEIAPGDTIYVRAYATNSDGTGYGNDVSFIVHSTVQKMLDYGMRPQYIVNLGYPVDSLYGKIFEEGVIISFDLENGGGLLCSPADVANAEWGCEGIPTGATSTIVGAGLYNTIQITHFCQITLSAASICSNYNNGWNADWYLPSKDEMLLVSERSEFIGGLSSGPYWTSSESFTQPESFAISISGGNITESNKSQMYNLRAIRHYGCEPAFDIEENYYPVIKIGSQTWLGDNLKTTKFQNGDPITYVTNATDWTTLSSDPLCSSPQDDPWTGSYYGRLYNHNAVTDSRNICPVGWHVPTDSDWDILINLLGGELVAGGMMKNVDLGMWDSPNTDATNISGFNALPFGIRDNLDGNFYYPNQKAFFWSANADNTTNSWYRSLQYNDGMIMRSTENNGTGMSVRCIKD